MELGLGLGLGLGSGLGLGLMKPHDIVIDGRVTGLQTTCTIDPLADREVPFLLPLLQVFCITPGRHRVITDIAEFGMSDGHIPCIPTQEHGVSV